MVDIERDIYPVLLAMQYQETLFSDLEGRKAAGKETAASCPFCNKAGHFSYSQERPVFQCWSCGEAGSWITYLQKREGLETRKAVNFLAEAAGIQAEGFDMEAYRARARKADILQAAMEHFKKALSQPEGKPVYAYLLDRGYTEQDIEAMPVGAYVSRHKLQEALKRKEYTERDIEESGLLSIGEDWPLVMAWTNLSGLPTGLAARAIEPGREPKYRYSKGLEKAGTLLGLDKVRGRESVLLVEGLLDCLLLSSRGLPVVALGGASLSKEQVQALEANKTKRVLLCLDSDKAGQAGMEKAIPLLQEEGLKAYVVSLPSGYKDADELARSQGLEPLHKAMEEAQRGSIWLALRRIQEQDTETDIGQDKAIDNALQVYGHIEDSLERQDCLRVISQAIGYTEETLLDRARLAEEQGLQERKEAGLRKALSEASRSLSEGKLDKVRTDIHKGLKVLEAGIEEPLPEPYLLADLERDLSRTGDGLSTGYDSLDNFCLIPEGALTIVAGRPGHGKTTLLLNMFLNMVRRKEDRAFYFFSYEEAARALATKAIMLLAGKVGNDKFNFGYYTNYLKEHRGTDRDIEEAVKKYEEYTASGRLCIVDTRYKAEGLSQVIGRLARSRKPGAFFIDYIQKIPLDRPQGQRYLDIKEASALLLDMAVQENVSVILGAQLRREGSQPKTGKKPASWKPRLEDLRESGDIEQDANLVLALVDERKQAEEEEDRVSQETRGKLNIYILKNRVGKEGASVRLSWNKPVFQLKDIAKTEKEPWA